MILQQTVSYRGATEVDSTIENDGAQLKKKKKKKKKFKAFAWLQSQDIVIHMEFLHSYFSKFTNALMNWSPD